MRVLMTKKNRGGAIKIATYSFGVSKADNAKTLKRTYATKQSATRAAALEWTKIKEVREIIAENNAD